MLSTCIGFCTHVTLLPAADCWCAPVVAVTAAAGGSLRVPHQTHTPMVCLGCTAPTSSPSSRWLTGAGAETGMCAASTRWLCSSVCSRSKRDMTTCQMTKSAMPSARVQQSWPKELNQQQIQPGSVGWGWLWCPLCKWAVCSGVVSQPEDCVLIPACHCWHLSVAAGLSVLV